MLVQVITVLSTMTEDHMQKVGRALQPLTQEAILVHCKVSNVGATPLVHIVIFSIPIISTLGFWNQF